MVESISNFIWTYILIAALLLIGLLLTFSSRFVQVRYFFRMFRVLGSAFHHEGGHVSSFQALVVSVAGRVGAGNIAGVAVAITLGGPGAVFWMWIVALIGMATSMFECTLGQLFKKNEPDGAFRGGPAFYIERGLGPNWRWLAILFSVLMLATFGLFFIALQSNTVAASFEDAFGVPEIASGILMAIVLGLIVFGGIKRIARVAEIIVPIMAIGYLVIALAVIVIDFHELPRVFLYIVESAFGLDAAVGGGIGAAILQGVQRGLFSNEAGLGSAPNVAAVAYVRHPINQGIVQSFSVFIDTIIMCTCTAAIILLSDVYQPGADINGAILTQRALAENVGSWGGSFVSLAVMLFAFSTIMYCYYLGENALAFFSENALAINGLRLAAMGLVVWGALQELETVLHLSNLTMGLLALVNLFALALLFKIVLRVLRDFDDQLAAGVTRPVFDSNKFSDLDIDHEAWRMDEEKPSPDAR
ncbi:MAG: alanine/glycine:cation symporter family protein [Pseudomonadota bacterium]